MDATFRAVTSSTEELRCDEHDAGERRGVVTTRRPPGDVALNDPHTACPTLEPARVRA